MQYGIDNSRRQCNFIERVMQYWIVQRDSPSHHTPRHDINVQFPFSNNIAQLPGLDPQRAEC